MKNKNKPSAYERFMALSDEAKEKEVAKFDEEFIAEKARPLSVEQRRLWEKAKRKRGRPVVGKGAQVISLSVEKSLLQKADAWAMRQGLSRAQLVAKGLRAVIGV